MDRLSMSLDDLIAEKAKNAPAKPRKHLGKKQQPRPTGAVRSNKKTNLRSVPYLSRDNDGDLLAPNKATRLKEANMEKQMRQQQQIASQQIRQPQAQEAKQLQQQAKDEQQNVSIFARIGKKPPPGTVVTFKNLRNSVGKSDIDELCSTIGEVKEVELNPTADGYRKASVLFVHRNDAENCCSKFNGLTLDGVVMDVSITTEEAPKSVFSRLHAQPEHQRAPPPVNNVREGLFGTAIAGSGREVTNVSNARNSKSDSANFHFNPQEVSSRPVTFSVTLNGGSAGSSNSTPVSAINQNHAAPNKQKQFLNNNAGNRSGRSRGKGGNGTNRAGSKKESSNVDLDAELDAYMASK